MEGISLASLVPPLAQVTVMGVMLSVGLSLDFRQLLMLWRKPGLLARSYLAVVILVPLVTLAVIKIFNLPPAVDIALMLMAVAPGSPLAMRRATLAGGDAPYAASLQFTVNLSAIITIPLFLYILSAFFEPQAYASPTLIAYQVTIAQFAPLIFGILLTTTWPGLTRRFGDFITRVANVMLVVLVVLVVLAGWRPFLDTFRGIGWYSFLAAAIIIGVSLTLGHSLGGPGKEKRTTLAVMSIARSLSLAVFLALKDFPGQGILGVFVAYILLGLVVQAVYVTLRKYGEKKAGAPA
ncbi:MAG: bile acid:sodium symporter [Candidatus Zixiibacteriota bacterium]|jgi:predicted Na+-dependent transporter